MFLAVVLSCVNQVTLYYVGRVLLLLPNSRCIDYTAVLFLAVIIVRYLFCLYTQRSVPFDEVESFCAFVLLCILSKYILLITRLAFTVYLRYHYQYSFWSQIVFQ